MFIFYDDDVTTSGDVITAKKSKMLLFTGLWLILTKLGSLLDIKTDILEIGILTPYDVTMTSPDPL